MLDWDCVVSGCTVRGLSLHSLGYDKVAKETKSKFVTQNSPIMQFHTTPAQFLVKVHPQTANLTGRLLHVPWPKFMLEWANLMCSFHGAFTDQQTFMTPNKTTILIESYKPASKVYGPKKGVNTVVWTSQINRFQCQIRLPQITWTEKM